MSKRIEVKQFGGGDLSTLIRDLSLLENPETSVVWLSNDASLEDKPQRLSSYIMFWGPPNASDEDIRKVLESLPQDVCAIGCSTEDCIFETDRRRNSWSAVSVRSRYLTPHAAYGELAPKPESGPATIDSCLDSFVKDLPKEYLTEGRRMGSTRPAGHGVQYLRPAYLLLFLPGMGTRDKPAWPSSNLDYQIVESLATRVSRNVAMFGGSAVAPWPTENSDHKWVPPWAAVCNTRDPRQIIRKIIRKGMVGLLVETDLAFGVASEHGLQPDHEHGHLVIDADNAFQITELPRLIKSMPPRYHVAELDFANENKGGYMIRHLDNPGLADSSLTLLPVANSRWNTLVAYENNEDLPNPTYRHFNSEEKFEFLRPVAKGSTLYRAIASRESVLGAIRKAIDASIANETVRLIEALFVVNCRGRLRLLGNETGPNEEMALINQVVPQDCSVFGMYGDGETCTSPRRVHLHRNWSFAVLALGSDFHERYASMAREQLLSGIDRMIEGFSDLDAVLERIAQLALILLGADSCHVRILSTDGKHLEKRAGCGDVSTIAVKNVNLEKQDGVAADTELIAYQAFTNRENARCSKAQFSTKKNDFGRWVGEQEHIRKIVDEVEWWLSVPILEMGECLGVMSIASRDRRFLGDKHEPIEKLALELATTAALPIRSTLMRSALQDALQAASEATNPDELATNIVKHGVRLLGRDAYLAMMLPDSFEQPVRLACKAIFGPGPKRSTDSMFVDVSPNAHAADMGICGYVFRNGVKWWSDCASEDADGSPDETQPLKPDGTRPVKPIFKRCIPGATANYVVPLMGKNGAGMDVALGVLNAEAPPKVLRYDVHMKVLLALAKACATSIEHYVREKEMWGYLDRLLPKHLVRGLQSSEPASCQGGPSLEKHRPEKKTISILCADIRGSTQLSEILGEERLRDFVDEYYEMLARAIGDTNGTLDKYLGDGVLALYGDSESIQLDGVKEASTETERETLEKSVEAARKALERAVEAGLRIGDAFQKLALKWLPRWRRERPQIGQHYRFEIGVLIHTGAPLVGLFQSNPTLPDGRMTFTAIGRDVNLASRLGQEVGGNAVYVTASAYELLKQSAKFETASEPMIVKDLKGIPYQFEIYQISRKR